MFGLIDLFRDTYTYRVIVEMAILTGSILPGLIIGLAVSSFLVAWWPIDRLKTGPFLHGAAAVMVMACVGIVSPFCTYLAIPIAAALILGGITPAPVFAFLCATPLMNPTLFAMTWSAFGWQMALARTVSAFGFGILGGSLAGLVASRIPHFFDLKHPEAIPSLENREQNLSFMRAWWNSFHHLGKFVVKYVSVGICIAAIVKEVIPISYIEAAVGRSHGYGILTGALLGVPLYACGGGTIPLIQVLMNMGMSPGAALAFFLAGPATKVPTLVTMQMTMGTFITGVYFFLALLWAVAVGFIYQFLF